MDHSLEFFINFCLTIWQFRIILVILFALIILGGLLFAKLEKLSWEFGIYFALETALTLGFGDIVGQTRLGRVITLMVGFLGLLLFGIIVAKATYALHLTMGSPKMF
jgi:hypothetical protein